MTRFWVGLAAMLLGGCTVYEKNPAASTTRATIGKPSTPSDAVAAYSGRVLSDNPLVLLPLNEGSGIALDRSGNGRDGTFQNPAAGFAPGPFGELLPIFDGAQTYVSLDKTPFQLTTFTVEIWFNVLGPSTTGVYNTLIARGNRTGLGREENFQIMVDADSHLVGRVGSGTVATDLESVFAIDPGWHHAALTCAYSPTGGTWSQVKLYLDGELVANTGFSGKPNDAAVGDLTIGVWETPSLYGLLNGQVTFAAVYEAELTEAQIKAHLD